MREDWLRIIADGEVAHLSPTTEHAIRTARALTGVPMGAGGIQIKLHAGGADIEIDIDPQGIVRAVSWQTTGW